jgi:hypothetical protein
MKKLSSIIFVLTAVISTAAFAGNPSQLPSSCFAAATAAAKNAVKATYGGEVSLNSKDGANGDKIIVHVQSTEFDDPLEVEVVVSTESGGRCKIVGSPEIFDEDPS